jgi:hypothetical protein
MDILTAKINLFLTSCIRNFINLNKARRIFSLHTVHCPNNKNYDTSWAVSIFWLGSDEDKSWQREPAAWYSPHTPSLNFVNGEESRKVHTCRTNLTTKHRTQ